MIARVGALGKQTSWKRITCGVNYTQLTGCLSLHHRNPLGQLCMSYELGYPFADIANDLRLTVPQVKSAIHQFHRQGLTGFGPLFNEDESTVCGSGYWLRKPGWEMQDQVERFLTRREQDDLLDPAGAVFRKDAPETNQGNT